MEIRLAHNDKCKIFHMKLVKIKQYQSCTSLEFFQRKYYGCWASTKAQFILHELVSQIPLFWNYEKFIHAY